MMNLFYFIVFFLTLLTSGSQAAKQPKNPASAYFKICHRSNPDLSNCVRNTIEDLRPKLIKGIPDLEIVSLDPLNIPRLEFNDGNGNFRFKQILTNVTIHGLGNFQLKDIKVDLDSLTIDMVMQTPFMMFTADYNMEGKILLLPLTGKGDCVLNFTDVTTSSNTIIKLVERNGEEFLETEELKWDISVEGCRLQFNNLFGGDKRLGETTNRFLNDNWREAFNTYRYLPEEAFGIVFKDFANKVYQKFPSKELFPE
ncbi:protein takeout-like [Zootermopsis nevadensis]|uniref:Protein takeout n=1 Tax=Zootermopsis nevadensis TaxID=136037 RepID=A0A067RQR4_ZOONE|nr:protein takeout-like [Zootermopsis nevadensis]XP_021914386.1 protein takeout-like [Zootermopsis nevadensis]KDR22094.1 Protein takeout [Zootermopsis nevadensis]